MSTWSCGRRGGAVVNARRLPSCPGGRAACPREAKEQVLAAAIDAIDRAPWPAAQGRREPATATGGHRPARPRCGGPLHVRDEAAARGLDFGSSGIGGKSRGAWDRHGRRRQSTGAADLLPRRIYPNIQGRHFRGAACRHRCRRSRRGPRPPRDSHDVRSFASPSSATGRRAALLALACALALPGAASAQAERPPAVAPAAAPDPAPTPAVKPAEAPAPTPAPAPGTSGDAGAPKGAGAPAVKSGLTADSCTGS